METFAAEVAINLIKIKIGSRTESIDPIINTRTMTNSHAGNGNTDLDNTPSRGRGGANTTTNAVPRPHAFHHRRLIIHVASRILKLRFPRASLIVDDCDKNYLIFVHIRSPTCSYKWRNSYGAKLSERTVCFCFELVIHLKSRGFVLDDEHSTIIQKYFQTSLSVFCHFIFT